MRTEFHGAINRLSQWKNTYYSEETMKQYKHPEIEVIATVLDDVITSSVRIDTGVDTPMVSPSTGTPSYAYPGM